MFHVHYVIKDLLFLKVIVKHVNHLSIIVQIVFNYLIVRNVLTPILLTKIKYVNVNLLCIMSVIFVSQILIVLMLIRRMVRFTVHFATLKNYFIWMRIVIVYVRVDISKLMSNVCKYVEMERK